jgi:hypothetical protein
MNIFKKLFGMDKVIEKGGEMIDEAMDTGQERAERDATDTASARAMTAPSHGTWFDALVDGLSRLVRPGVTLWMIGGFIGWWPLPKTEAISEYWQNLFMLVITFWFGGRAILKDLPAAIRSMRGK